ncbi:UNVERIFIED_CONTAM: hypothetical protein PYX00_007749 [Menopon gallinae]|uniref:Uncharacterized protein n=1 Tax=Menopon gallinae TaxID=328185 RepID=A0AAW2HLM4_9NEOP
MDISWWDCWNSESAQNLHHLNSEKRKEKSRDAARCRRSRETEIFSDMAKGLPLPPSVITQLDKASVMRLVISYLKIQNLVSMIPEKITQDKLHDSLFLKALEGFIVIISAEGDLVYLSENVNEYLGITQVDLMGNSIYEFSHPCDHEEIRDVLSIKSPQELFRSFFVRLKCTLTSKGRNVNLKSATYKVIHCSGRVFLKQPLKSEQERKLPSEGANNQHYLVAIGEPIPHPANIEIPLDKQTFLSKHSLDMKFTYADEKMIEFLGYNPEDLIGKTLFDFYHAMDSEAIDRGFKTLFSKGQCETGKYRFLAKGGGYVWVLTQATMIYGNKGQKPNSIVCVNFVISGIENKNEIYSCTQLLGKKGIEEEEEEEEYRVKAEAPQTSVPKFVTAKIFASSVKKDAAPVTRPTAVTSKIFARLPKQEKPGNALPVNVSTAPTNSLFPVSPNTLSPVPESEKPRTLRPQLATSKIFAPRTEDMNKGFLTFSDDEPGLTMLKDEPEDLTHLAPTAGDVCVPLDLPQITDMFDDFLSENYCPLLTNELNSLSDSQSSKASGDPFISYRDETESAGSPTDLNSRLRSPPLTKSPGGCSIPSLCSPERSPILTDDDHMTNFMSLNIDSGGSEMDEDLCLKAPFIPLDEDLPLLISATDLMWSSPPEKINTPSKDYTDTWPPPIKPESSLAELLLNDSFSPPASANRKLRPVVHLSEALNISSSKKNDHSWQMTVDEPIRAKMSPALPRSEKLLHNHRRSPPGVGPPSGERKRAHSGHPEADQNTKRTKKPEKMPSQLLQHLVSSPRAKGRDEGVWIADGGGGAESPPKIQSHSVLMNLLVSGCDVSHGYICIGSSRSRNRRN